MKINDNLDTPIWKNEIIKLEYPNLSNMLPIR